MQTFTPRSPCYLDNNATTPVAPEVTQTMLPYFERAWGNPSSSYAFGRGLAKALDQAREKTAALIHADPREIVFTSCGTESNNTAIHSALTAFPAKRHVVTTAVEHSSNISYCQFLQKQGFDVTFVGVDEDGLIDLHLLERSIRPDTAIVSVMWANNETGVVFPIEEIAALCRSKEVLFHTDAVQAAGKLQIDAHATGVDFLSLSAHKIHAPKGIGLLYVRRRTPFHPLIYGGHQERGRRGGTENVPYIIGFGRAAELALQRCSEENIKVRALRDRLEKSVLSAIPGSRRNGAAEPRLPNTSNISFNQVEAEAVLMLLDQAGICASSGSACASGSMEPSHVLVAMGLNPAQARGSIRFSLGFYNSDEDIAYLLKELPGIVERLRAGAALPSAKPHAVEA